MPTNIFSPLDASPPDSAPSGPFSARLRAAATPRGAGTIDLSRVPAGARHRSARGAVQDAPSNKAQDMREAPPGRDRSLPTSPVDNDFPGALSPDGIPKNYQHPTLGVFQAPRVTPAQDYATPDHSKPYGVPVAALQNVRQDVPLYGGQYGTGRRGFYKSSPKSATKSATQSDPKPALQLGAPVVPRMASSATSQPGELQEAEEPADMQVAYTAWGEAYMTPTPRPRPLTPGETIPRAPEEKFRSSDRAELEHLLSWIRER
ncbi:uncharacterized protein BDZ99DRAFT_514332 [Mytilinidion resinicola]|uniref:Uncharacterized protein n=1 Tax=Mytilinidion resinicola TaxID=574789 RepID=A0A6A6Z3E4_9PEZI|nr:uncharacterized protein BDZ99DRAFT_514332 [Mytilinidion resinicola]KAF2815682.1 hypothetical protein BDZ99DRAFT_514332 [Mytilinidion resinicola]